MTLARLPASLRRLAVCCVVASLVLAALPVRAACLQPRSVAGKPARPTIGLVLSGGGARGGAHIGALEALEQLRVPIDCIAGTSIGAVVGGFYATGLRAKDLENIVTHLDWNALFLDTTPRRLLAFRRKRDEDLFLVNLKPGLNAGQIELPIGIVQGQVADQILARYTLPAAEIQDFDKLPIPFRAVATNIANGKAVVLGSGNLARAIRASMAIPAALTPVEIDHQLLVDGGLAMNLPVEVARDMGADVIIAIDITASLLKREALHNVLDVTTQLTNLLTRQGLDKQRKLLGPKDVLLTPQFPPAMNSVDFSHMADAIETGYDAVMRHRAELEPYALTREQYAAYLARRPASTLPGLPVIDFVTLDNHSHIADSIIETRLRGLMLGKPLDFATIQKAIDQVYGLDLFQNVRYSIVKRGDETGVEVEVVPKSWGPNYLQLGMQYSSTEDSDALFALAASYLRTAIDPHGGEWRTVFEIGDQPAVTFDAYQPLGPKGLFFVEPTLTLHSIRYDVFAGEQLLSQAQLHEAGAEFSGGRELMTWGEVRGGLRRGYGETKLIVGEPAMLPAPKYQRGEFFVRFSADTLDDIAFPSRGVLATAEWRASRPTLGSDASFDQFMLSATFAKSWGRHTLLSRFRYDTTFSGRAPLNRAFKFGGFLDLSGLNQGQLKGQHVARIGASYYRRIGNLTFLPAYAGVSVELGNAWNDRESISRKSALLGGSIWAGVDSPVGPIYVGYGRTEGGIKAYYVYLGRAF